MKKWKGRLNEMSSGDSSSPFPVELGCGWSLVMQETNLGHNDQIARNTGESAEI
jgi:hypothetical protein